MRHFSGQRRKNAFEDILTKPHFPQMERTFGNSLSFVLHLKMMRLLFLCLLLLLPASADIEGSGDVPDDEDLYKTKTFGVGGSPESGQTRGEAESSSPATTVIIVVAALVLTLSIAAIVTIILVRHKVRSPQQGIYSVPMEQDQKEAV